MENVCDAFYSVLHLYSGYFSICSMYNEGFTSQFVPVQTSLDYIMFHSFYFFGKVF